jgi:hypothetical protein
MVISFLSLRLFSFVQSLPRFLSQFLTNHSTFKQIAKIKYRSQHSGKRGAEEREGQSIHQQGWVRGRVPGSLGCKWDDRIIAVSGARRVASNLGTEVEKRARVRESGCEETARGNGGEAESDGRFSAEGKWVRKWARRDLRAREQRGIKWGWWGAKFSMAEFDGRNDVAAHRDFTISIIIVFITAN